MQGDACTQIVPWQFVNEDASTTPMSELGVDADASTPPPFIASTAAAARSPRNSQLAQLRPEQGDEEAPRRAPQGDAIYGPHWLWSPGCPMHLVTLYSPSCEIEEGMTQIQTNWLGEPEDSGRIGVFQVQRPSSEKIKLITRYIRGSKTLVVVNFVWCPIDGVYKSTDDKNHSLGRNPAPGFMLRLSPLWLWLKNDSSTPYFFDPPPPVRKGVDKVIGGRGFFGTIFALKFISGAPMDVRKVADGVKNHARLDFDTP